MANSKFKTAQDFFNWYSGTVSEVKFSANDIQQAEDGDYYLTYNHGKLWLTESGEPNWYNLYGAAAEDYKAEV